MQIYSCRTTKIEDHNYYPSHDYNFTELASPSFWMKNCSVERSSYAIYGFCFSYNLVRSNVIVKRLSWPYATSIFWVAMLTIIQ